MSPPTNFWNFGNTSVTKTEQRHYTDASSTQVFGNLRAKANRLAREAALNFSNALRYSNIKLNLSLTKLLTGMTYDDEEGETKQIEPPPFDLGHQAAQMSRWWRFYEWHRNLCSQYLVFITKDDYRKAQQAIQSGTKTQAKSYAALERVPAAIVLPVQERPLLEAEPEHIVDTIVERKMVNGKVRTFFINPCVNLF